MQRIKTGRDVCHSGFLGEYPGTVPAPVATLPTGHPSLKVTDSLEA